ncbi:Uncharacterized protein Fot_50747 [Forsythia ovata]|uniref:glutathione transferase n=1 Tax=Forsythia ovata TaxID=205694 RepID=A0ABD1PZ43_9LAMI
MNREEVKVLGSGVSPFEWRIIWALKLKGVEFEFIKEDIFKKSSLLLESNPVYKMIPVFIHGQNAIADSLIILEYIDESWKQNPIMPKDPHEKAYTRFWAKFSEDQLVEPSRIAFQYGGEEQAKAVKVMADALEILEGELRGKKFFGGETMGYLDIVVGWVGYWLQFTQQVGNYKVMDSEKYPEIHLWINRFLQVPIIEENLPPFNEMLSIPFCPLTDCPNHAIPVYKQDIDLMQFALNLEHLEADFFLYSALGYGLDKVAPYLVMGGPPPIGAQKANLDFLTHNIITEFGFQEVGHLRAIKTTVGGFPRPQLDLSPKNFAKFFNEAFGYELVPPFNPYRDSLNFMLASYVIPYVGLLGYVGTNPNINGCVTKRLLAGLLGVESGQDAYIRGYLYERANEVVFPYNYTVAEFTIRASELRNRLAMCGIKDEGILVPPQLGAENRTESNLLSANYNSLSYGRTPAEILRIVYSTGDEHVPGGFFPEGANGRIARELLGKP